MNLKVNSEPVKFNERICSCTQEQPIELDYVLPDYYPEIFRIAGCRAEPRITACAVSGDKVSYELTVCLKVIYCPDGGGRPEAVDQKLVYSRTVNLDRAAPSPSVYISACADHINCRAVNRRRIDIRGAVTISVNASGETGTDIISEVFGGNVQLKKKSCTCPSDVIRVQKRVTVSDEFETGADAPPIGSILRVSADIVSADKKIIASKAAAKGEIRISLLYSPADGDGSKAETMQFSLPFSQLIDMEGLDDSCECFINSDVISCDVTPRTDSDGGSGKLECEILLLIDCLAVKMSVYEIACDEYSTSHSSSHTCIPVKMEKQPVPADSTIVIKGVCENKDSPLSTVYDSFCDTSKLRAAVKDGKLSAAGNITLTVMGQAENGDFVICETDVPVEEDIPLPVQNLSDSADVRINFSVISCGYTISSGSAAEVKAEIAARGRVTDCSMIEAITEISVDESSPRETNGEYALRLYFAGEGEDLWEVAKKYGARLSRIMEENELDSDTVKDQKMLLIPAL